MCVCVVRFEETIDMSTTIKFVYVRWNGSEVNYVKRGKYGVVLGSVEKLLTVSLSSSGSSLLALFLL